MFIAVATSLKSDVLSMIPAQIVSQADELRLYVVSKSRSFSLDGGGIWPKNNSKARSACPISIVSPSTVFPPAFRPVARNVVSKGL